MPTKRIALCCVLLSVGPVSAACVAEGPLDTSRWIFTQHRDFYVHGRDSAVDSYLSSRLVELLKRNWACEKATGGVCAIEAEPWLNAQYGSALDPIRFQVDAITGASATVRVSYLFGEPSIKEPKAVPAMSKLRFVLDNKSGCWLLDDLFGRERLSLKAQLERFPYHGP